MYGEARLSGALAGFLTALVAVANMHNVQGNVKVSQLLVRGGLSPWPCAPSALRWQIKTIEYFARG